MPGPPLGHRASSPARQLLHARSFDCRHRHLNGYVALVLRGGYCEAGDEGRREVGVGDVLVHQPFEAHRNWIGPEGAEVLNLPIAGKFSLPSAGRTPDPESIARIAQVDPDAAAIALLAAMAPPSRRAQDWPDLLAEQLKGIGCMPIGRWAATMGLAPETVSRQFKKVYGVSPARFRFEIRARRAWERIATGSTPLSEIALICGFSDQAHMTRAVGWLTGATPSYWRRMHQIDSRPKHPKLLSSGHANDSGSHPPG